MLNETQIYIALKEYLSDNYWQILGGEPPGGTDHLPVIELKDPINSEKGSKGSKKVDLICFKESYFLLLELKPRYSFSDVSKLNGITSKQEWREAFLKALEDKKVLPLELTGDRSLYTKDSSYLIKAVGYNEHQPLGPEDFVTFLVGNGVNYSLGKDVPYSIRKLF